MNSLFLSYVFEFSPGLLYIQLVVVRKKIKVKSRLAGQVTSFSISSRGTDITRYLRFRLGHDETPDAMDERLKAEVLRIPQSMSEMYVKAIVM